MAPRLGPGPTLRVAQPCWVVKKGPKCSIFLGHNSLVVFQGHSRLEDAHEGFRFATLIL
jgi:hypothetical protein